MLQKNTLQGFDALAIVLKVGAERTQQLFLEAS